MWVRFTKPFSFKPTVNSTVDYKPGNVVNVTTKCADAAVAAGAAEKVDKTQPAAAAAPKKAEA